MKALILKEKSKLAIENSSMNDLLLFGRAHGLAPSLDAAIGGR